jgi:hypothetical protein
VSQEELEKLIVDCPRLFHMAERGAWDGIRRHGLLSTTAILDLFGIDGQQRLAIERKHRAGTVEISDDKLGKAAIRDQIPVSDAGLRCALPSHATPADWYARLNGMVFFWLTESRLLRLTPAEIKSECICDAIRRELVSL